MKTFTVILIATLAVRAAAVQPMPNFVDVTVESGLTYRNIAGHAKKQFMLETQSAGIGWWDVDADGDLDTYLVGGADLDDSTAGGGALYLNAGDGTFLDVTQTRGVTLAGRWSMGCAIADYDNDGDGDLFVSGWGPNALLRNDLEMGVFTDVSAVVGVADPGWGVGAAFADYDGDGDLDLYVANYVDFVLHGPPFYDRMCTHNGIPAACGPLGFTPQQDLLYRNDDGKFTDVTAQTGVSTPQYYGMGVVWSDFDGDGDPDLYVANDGQPNRLFRNDAGRFRDVALLAGVAYSGTGKPQASMGLATADYDGDGDLDLFVTNFSQDYNTLYRNDGGMIFTDVTFAAAMGSVSRPQMGWGAIFFDADQDGWLDLFIANGHLMPAIDRAGVGLRYRQRNQLLRGSAKGKFTDISAAAGPGMQVDKVSRGAAVADYDDDGDLDVLVANIDDTATLLRNEASGGHWLLVDLIGAAPNTAAIGARLLASVGGRQLLAEVITGGSFQSQSDTRLHLGLGKAQIIDELHVRWPDGSSQIWSAIPVDRVITLQQGQHTWLPASP